MRHISVARMGTSAAFVAILAAGSAVAATSLPSKHESVSRAQPIASVSAAQTSSFGVLRQPPVTAVPPGVERMAADPGIAAIYAPNPALARVVEPSPGTEWYLIPGNNSMCFYTGEFGGCQTLADAQAGKLFVFGLPQTAAGKTPTSAVLPGLIVGVAPDTITSATASTPAGALATRPTGGGAYQLQAGAIRSITLGAASGPVTFNFQA